MLPKTNDYIFGNGNLNAFRWKYDRQKHALSIKLQNPPSNKSGSTVLDISKRPRNMRSHETSFTSKNYLATAT